MLHHEGVRVEPFTPLFRLRTAGIVPGPNTEIKMLINVIITLLIVGVLLWLVNTYLPMDAKIKSILNIVIVIAVIIWLVRSFGLL